MAGAVHQSPNYERVATPADNHGALPPLPGIAGEFLPRAHAVLDTLQSHFIEMPRGSAFLERAEFEAGYRVFAEQTRCGSDLSSDALLRAIEREPRAWVVLRSILGFTPGEMFWVVWRETAGSGNGVNVSQTDARELDLAARRGEQLVFSPGKARLARERRRDELVRRALPPIANVLQRSAPEVESGSVHRLDKIDTRGGPETVAGLIRSGQVAYSELLYERVLGRPFATHRDSVSDIVGKMVEGAVQALLDEHLIDGRQTRYREKVATFPQAPDFLIPSDPGKTRLIIEAKLTEDDGTARDKAARIQTLRGYEDRRRATGDEPRQIVAVVEGRGFLHRTPDLQRMLEACDGHVYSLAELPLLVAPGGVLAPFIGTRLSEA